MIFGIYIVGELHLDVVWDGSQVVALGNRTTDNWIQLVGEDRLLLTGSDGESWELDGAPPPRLDMLTALFIATLNLPLSNVGPWEIEVLVHRREAILATRHHGAIHRLWVLDQPERVPPQAKMISRPHHGAGYVTAYLQGDPVLASVESEWAGIPIVESHRDFTSLADAVAWARSRAITVLVTQDGRRRTAGIRQIQGLDPWIDNLEG